MPKQVNFVPNERVDLDDLTYGTSGFTVDSLKSHVQRLISGDYAGGFVLEGFRVEIVDATLRKIFVHNGIALDRDGRLITLEDGDNFSSNVDIEKEYILTSAAGDHYVMIEFAFDDTDSTDTRAIWDPTYENPNIEDSAGNTHAAPNGREIPLDIPTRRAISWRVVVNTTGFSDRGDLGTDGHTLRIPIAIIPVDGGTGFILTPLMTQERPWTTVIETPQEDGTFLVCANTRLFAETGSIQILNRLGQEVVAAADCAYAHNDDDNNVISGITQNAPPTLLGDVRAGDIVVLDQAPSGTFVIPNYLAAGSKYDCRPMLFSFTDPIADSEETSSLERNPRNQRFEAAIALLRKYVTSTTTVEYPSSGAAYAKFELTEEPDRVEFNLKQGQDLLRSIGALIREMKYGDPVDIEFNLSYGPFSSSTGTLLVPSGGSPTNTEFAFFILSNHPGFHSGLNSSLIGATITFTGTTPTIPLQNQSTIIRDISAPIFNSNPASSHYFQLGICTARSSGVGGKLHLYVMRCIKTCSL